MTRSEILGLSKLSEEWRTHPIYMKYEISNMGKIRNAKNKKERRLRLYSGYKKIVLKDNNGKLRLRPLHHLVLETFVGPKPENKECCHNNGIKTDNRVNNLRWDTRRENVKDSIRCGSFKRLSGETNGRSKLKTLDVICIIEYRRKGYSDRKIGKMFNISYTMARDIFMGVNWRHIHNHLIQAALLAKEGK